MTIQKIDLNKKVARFDVLSFFKPFKTPKATLLILLLFLSINNLFPQEIKKTDSILPIKSDHLKFDYKALLIPSALAAYGIIGIESDALKGLNTNIREEVTEDIDDKFTIDDFSQYAPAIAVYGLNLFGVEGKNNFRDRSIILGTSYLLMGTWVTVMKKTTHIQRPDKSGFNSFPSGHTATAFASAEFLWQEYKDVSFWYGISGYIVATGTGFFRIYNDKHWLTDVAMGAGIGILSTKIAYWVFPLLENHIFKRKEKQTTAIVTPFYNGEQLGVGLLVNLN
jgi:hypothetical protein